ncbi:flagellar protein FlaG [Viridibacillus sp. NPDC096237]|uniref:flagellar protein FlaG n=1 Tax=Viridibacillus sp. NPDC096237 TaxID=3390721 RepID=UPI003CFF76FC
MRITANTQIDTTIQAPNAKTASKETATEVVLRDSKDSQNELTTKETCERAVNKLNEFMEVHNKNSKFVFHEKLDRYYVQVVDAETEEVVKEIPPKELLDAYYQMQKNFGKIVDEII